MQQVYRRHSQVRTRYMNKKVGIGKDESYKKHIAKQAVCSVLVFLSLISIKTSEDKNMVFTANSVRYIVNNQTDIKKTYENVLSFFSKKFSKKQLLEETISPLAEISPPVNSKIMRGFGNENQNDEFHYGVDFYGEAGDKVSCVLEGQAQEIGYSEKYGNYILIKHSDKFSSFYANCEKILPEVGDKIKAGQVIATIGIINNESFLHFEIREGDMSLDPTAFLDIK